MKYFKQITILYIYLKKSPHYEYSRIKRKKLEKLINEAENLGIENASTLRRQEIYFAILKKLAEKGEEITGGGVLQLLQDGFGFLRAMESNYLPGADDIYVSPNQIRRFGLKNWRYS